MLDEGRRGEVYTFPETVNHRPLPQAEQKNGTMAAPAACLGDGGFQVGRFPYLSKFGRDGGLQLRVMCSLNGGFPARASARFFLTT